MRLVRLQFIDEQFLTESNTNKERDNTNRCPSGAVSQRVFLHKEEAISVYWFLRFLSKIFCLMPRSLAEGIGCALGELFWLVLPKRRKNLAVDNIMRCLETNEKEAVRIAKKSSVRFGPMITEVLRFPVIKDNIADYVTITGKEYLDEAFAKGKGVVMPTSHSGNWELLGGALALNGWPLVGVAMKQRSSGADKFINEYRTLIGMHITYKTGVREMFDMLKKGWAIGLLMDQDTNLHDGLILEFFGRRTNCVPGAATLARFNDAPMVPVFMHRDKYGHHTVKLYPPVYLEKTGNKRADIRRTTQDLVKIIEEDIREYPEEWFWLHDRWKSVREEMHLEN